MTPAQAKKLAAKAKRERFERMLAHQVLAARLPTPIMQHRFATAIGREWRADFAWPELKVLLEVEGGIWQRGGGAHSRPGGVLRDMEKANDAALLGYRVLRFSTDEIKSGHALRFLERVIVPRGTPTAEAPLPASAALARAASADRPARFLAEGRRHART